MHRNPRTVKLPDAQPINKKYKTEFAALAQERLDDLSGSKQALLTMLSSNKSAETRAADD